MEKLPQGHQKSRSEWDKSQSLLAAATDRKIRNIIITRKSGPFLDPKHVHIPQEKIQITDTNEIVSQLTLLRGCMDREKFSFTRGGVRLHRLKSEDSKIEQVILQRKLTIENLKTFIKEIEVRIVQVLDLQLLEEDSQEVYYHVLDRMRTTIVFLKRRYFKLDQSLRLQTIHLNQSLTKSTKAKEAKYTISQAYSIFKDETDFEVNSKQKELEKVDKDLTKQKELTENRFAHRKMQEEMREQAMIEDHSSQLEGIREKYLLHFMWHMVSTVRFRKEQIKWKRYEDAFLRIKLATGIHDIPTLVEKYLTKEQNYSEFLFSVKAKEKELVDYQKKIKTIQREIEKLNEREDSQIDKAKFEELGNIRKMVFEENEKKELLIIVHTKIKDWCKKFISRVSSSSKEEVVLPDGKIEYSMKLVKDLALKTMKNLKNDAERFKSVHEMIERNKLSGILEKVPQGSRLRKSVIEKFELSDLAYLESDEVIKKHK